MRTYTLLVEPGLVDKIKTGNRKMVFIEKSKSPSFKLVKGQKITLVEKGRNETTVEVAKVCNLTKPSNLFGVDNSKLPIIAIHVR